MPKPNDNNIETQLYDTFLVAQVKRDTLHDEAVGIDLLTKRPGQDSKAYCDSFLDTVLCFTDNNTTVFVGGVPHQVAAGDRVFVRKEDIHGVSTPRESVGKLRSAQTPPILTDANGFRARGICEKDEAAEIKGQLQ